MKRLRKSRGAEAPDLSQPSLVPDALPGVASLAAAGEEAGEEADEDDEEEGGEAANQDAETDEEEEEEADEEEEAEDIKSDGGNAHTPARWQSRCSAQRRGLAAHATSDAESSPDAKSAAPRRSQRLKVARERRGHLAGSTHLESDADALCATTASTSRGDFGTAPATPPRIGHSDISESSDSSEDGARRTKGDHFRDCPLPSFDKNLVEAWEKDLLTRGAAAARLFELDDDPSECRRVAFTTAKASVKELRYLPRTCFLSGLPVFGGDSRVNLQLLLGARRQLLSSGGVPGSHLSPESQQIFWLAAQAYDLDLVDATELRRGRMRQQQRRRGRDGATASSPRARPVVVVEAHGHVRFPQRKKDHGAAPAEGSSEEEQVGGEEDEIERFKRRYQTIAALKKRAVEKQAEIVAGKSHALDLETVKKELFAPTLSFDWVDRQGAASDSEGEGLEVEAPTLQNQRSSLRSLYDEHLRRAVSRTQAMTLFGTSTNADASQIHHGESIANAEAAQDVDATAPARSDEAGPSREERVQGGDDDEDALPSRRRRQRLVMSDGESGHEAAGSGSGSGRLGATPTACACAGLPASSPDVPTALANAAAAADADAAGVLQALPCMAASAAAESMTEQQEQGGVARKGPASTGCLAAAASVSEAKERPLKQASLLASFGWRRKAAEDADAHVKGRAAETAPVLATGAATCAIADTTGPSAASDAHVSRPSGDSARGSCPAQDAAPARGADGGGAGAPSEPSSQEAASSGAGHGVGRLRRARSEKAAPARDLQQQGGSAGNPAAGDDGSSCCSDPGEASCDGDGVAAGSPRDRRGVGDGLPLNDSEDEEAAEALRVRARQVAEEARLHERKLRFEREDASRIRDPSAKALFMGFCTMSAEERSRYQHIVGGDGGGGKAAPLKQRPVVPGASRPGTLLTASAENARSSCQETWSLYQVGSSAPKVKSLGALLGVPAGGSAGAAGAGKKRAQAQAPQRVQKPRRAGPVFAYQ